jgi:hypothetical protein
MRKIEWSAVGTWALGFGLVAYLGLKGGGYDPLVHDQIGIAIWWILLGKVDGYGPLAAGCAGGSGRVRVGRILGRLR